MVQALGSAATIMDCDGLALEWEGSCDIRELVRTASKLLVYPSTAKFCQATRPNCINNSGVLKPMIRRLNATPKFALPHLEPLQREVSLVLQKLGAQPGGNSVYKTAVELKKLLSFLKRRASRKEVTKDMGPTQ